MMITKPSQRQTLSLTIHPDLRDLPRWSEDDPQFVAFCRDIHKRGIIDPIRITEQGEIADGRHRWWAACILKLESVPVIIIDRSQVSQVIVQSLIQRRHYTKGAIAYMLVPTVTHRKNALEIFAEESGLSLRLLEQAVEVRKIFNEDKDYRNFVEPKILAGEIGLGAVIAGWEGRKATKGLSKKIADQVKLWDRTLGDLTNRFKAWDKFGEAEKLQVVSKLGTTVESMPTDLIWKLNNKIIAEMKRRKEEAKI